MADRGCGPARNVYYYTNTRISFLSTPPSVAWGRLPPSLPPGW